MIINSTVTFYKNKQSNILRFLFSQVILINNRHFKFLVTH